MSTYHKLYRIFKFLLFILGMMILPTVIVLALYNPMLKNYTLFCVFSSVLIVILSIFGAETVSQI